MSDRPLEVRPATEADAALLLDWRNDERTRLASRTTDPVRWDDHVRWLRSTLARDDRLLVIVESQEPVGVVRWDRLDADAWELSITLAPDARGRRLGLAVLAAGEAALLGTVGAARLVAVTRVENAAARRLFSTAGYVPTASSEDGMLTFVRTVGR